MGIDLNTEYPEMDEEECQDAMDYIRAERTEELAIDAELAGRAPSWRDGRRRTCSR